MMGRQGGDQSQLFYLFNLERRIPACHLLRRINPVVTQVLADLRGKLRPFYSDIGRPSIDPELMIRMLIIGYCYGIRFERKLCEEVELHLAYRWFCRLDLDDKVPDHSTFSVNRHGRFRDSNLLRQVFEAVVRACMDAGLVKGEGFAVDASVIEADASRYHGKARDEIHWSAPERQTRAVAEFLGALDAEDPNADRQPPKVISPVDPYSPGMGVLRSIGRANGFLPRLTTHDTILPFSFPAVHAKKVTAAFDGGRLTSNGGVMLLAMADRRLGLADNLARVFPDRRDPTRIVHCLTDMFRARMFAICCGYEDADDLDHLRCDPAFKLACGRLPDTGRDLCSQPTLSRLENAPRLRDVIRLTYALVYAWMDSYAQEPATITLDIDDTCDVVHGHQQLSLFNAHYDERCFLPIHVYDTEKSRPVAVVLRPGKTPGGVEVRAHLRRLVRHIRTRWHKTRITFRGDGHYARPEAMTWCENNGIDYIFGLSGTKPLARKVDEVADDIRTRCAIENLPVLRGYTETRHKAKSWDRERRTVARIEVTTLGLDIRFVVTSLDVGSAEWIYDSLYCARGQAENLIKLHKTQLASDRTSCRSALANQVRLVLHIAAYWLMLTVRDAIPKARELATAEFATLRLRLLKIAARVVETTSRIRLAFAAACPEADLFRSLPGALLPLGP